MTMTIDATTALVFMGVPSAVTGLCFWLIQKNITKRDKERDQKDKARERKELLLIQSVGAALSLGEATAKALRDGKCNGEIGAALDYAKKVKHNQRDFLTEHGIKNLS